MTFFAPCWCNFSTLFCLFSWSGKTLYQVVLPLRQILQIYVYARLPCLRADVSYFQCCNKGNGRRLHAGKSRTDPHCGFKSKRWLQDQVQPGLSTRLQGSMLFEGRVRLYTGYNFNDGYPRSNGNKKACWFVPSWWDLSKIKLLFLNKKHEIINQFTTYKY